MQKILDRSQASLAQAFASLVRNAKRQRRLYLATVVSLMLIVVMSALLLALLAADKQLDFRRTLATQYAADISLLLHREESFLRRSEYTLDFYQHTHNVLRLPEGFEASIRRSGTARGVVGAEGLYFDVLVGDAARVAWGPALGAKLWRLYEAGRSMLATQHAFELRHRAMLLGLDEDYGVILPAAGVQAAHASGGGMTVAATATGARASDPAAPLGPAVIGRLRESLIVQLQTQTGRRAPAKGERIWLGPYRDPLQGTLMMTAVSAAYIGATPTALIAMSISVDALYGHLARSASAGTLLLMTTGRRVIVSSPSADAATERMLQDAAASLSGDQYRYTRGGVILLEPLMQGFGWMVGYLPWRGLIGTLGWQLAALAGVALLTLTAIGITARVWGLRLLRSSFAETARALESETLNHILVSATPVGLCIVRQSDDALLTVNALAGKLLRIVPDERRLLAPLSPRLSSPSLPHLPPHIVAALRAQPAVSHAAAVAKIAVFVVPAIPAQTDAPHEQFLQVTYAPARYAGEDVWFCAILDVTAQHALEQQLRLAQQTSDTMLRERSDFFASMSHEIRTPLNALLGNLELFARTPGLDAHTQRLATLGVAADALRRVVGDILDFSKIDAGEMKLVTAPFRLIDDLENLALSYASMAADRAIRFYPRLSPSLDQVLNGDRTRIAQILNNLLGNAFKFTPGGKITFHAEVKQDLRGRSVLMCRVCDSGIGMDPALVSRIFRPFVQGDASASNRYGGTGLGLSICARLCKLMDGQIAVESAVGAGSVFSVSIPLAPTSMKAFTSPSGVARVLPRVLPVSSTTGDRALVLCQEAEAGQIIEGWLRRSGWSVGTVCSAQAAQAALRVKRPDVLVVTDEYDLDTIAALRAVQAVCAVWVTPTGAHRAERRGDGVLEVSAFSHAAILAAVQEAHDGGRIESSALVLPAPAHPSAIDPALQGLAILVAEDNPLNRTLIVEQLRALGAVPTVVGDGRQALAMIAQRSFDVVLTDIHMPLLDGYQLLAALRARQRDLPVVAFSAITDRQPVDSWRERGFAAYVGKPASLDELAAALSTVVAVSRGSAAGHGFAPAFAQRPIATPGADNTARYLAMLKDHLDADLPRLSAIVARQDRQSLRDWAHGAGGAFLVVGEPQFATQCCELQRVCDANIGWRAELGVLAMSLHGQLCSRFGLDEQGCGKVGGEVI